MPVKSIHPEHGAVCFVRTPEEVKVSEIDEKFKQLMEDADTLQEAVGLVGTVRQELVDLREEVKSLKREVAALKKVKAGVGK